MKTGKFVTFDAMICPTTSGVDLGTQPTQPPAFNLSTLRAARALPGSAGTAADSIEKDPTGQKKELHMTCNLAVVEIGQDYLDWATKLRQGRYPTAGAVTHDDVGRYGVQDPDGAIVADGFPDRKLAEQCANHLKAAASGGEMATDNFAGRLEEEDSWDEDQWCAASVELGGTTGIKDPGARFTELKAVTIVFRYPLTRKARLKFRSETGFTRAEIIECIRSGYRRIYAEEREESKWGIWGHEMGNLLIESVEVDDDTGIVNLGIGS